MTTLNIVEHDELIREQKMSRSARRLFVSPVCIAGVRISVPNFSARCGRTKL